MTTVWVTFLFAFVVSALFTVITYRVAHARGWFDLPDGFRKLHTRPIPRLGGVAIFISFFATLAVAYFLRDYSQLAQRTVIQTTEHPHMMKGLFGGALLLLVVGVYDDLKGLAARRKFFFQLLAAIIAYAVGFQINAITVPWVGSVDFAIFALPVTLFWFVGCINAVNLLDGMDGLAAGACMFVFLTLLLVGLNFENTTAMMMACAGGATLGFLMFNFPPARIFLGDSGSMLLGFLVAALSLVGTSRKAQAAVALFIPIVALGLPIFDSAMAIIRRWYRRLPLAMPDRQHIHHILISMGYSQQKSVLILYGICVVLAGAALLITIGGDETTALVIGSLLVMGFIAIRIFSGVKIRGAMAKLLQDNVNRQKEIQSRIILEIAIQRFSTAATLPEIWAICIDTFTGWNLVSASLTLPGRPPFQWVNPLHPTNLTDNWSSSLHVRLDAATTGVLAISQHIEFPQAFPRILVEFRDALNRVLIRTGSHA